MQITSTQHYFPISPYSQTQGTKEAPPSPEKTSTANRSSSPSTISKLATQYASPSNRAATSDSVQISDEAKQLSQSPQMTKSTTSSLDESNLPLEFFAVPKWMLGWTSEQTSQDLTPPKGLPLGLNTSAVIDVEFSPEAKEYMTKLGEYFHQTLKSQGVTTHLDYYNNVLKDQESSENIRLAMKERLAEDPRMMELMEFFNIDL